VRIPRPPLLALIGLLAAAAAVAAAASGWLVPGRDSCWEDLQGCAEYPSPLPRTARVTWNPLARQQQEPDTLFLFDADEERRREPGEGGFIMNNSGAGDLPWRADSKIVAAPGRYRTGVKSRDREYGYLWMPASGLLSPREFTVELWLKAARPWGEITDNSPLGIMAGADQGTWLNVHDGVLHLRHSHRQSPAGPTNVDLTADVSAVPAERWVNVAFTLRAGMLTLYLDGKQVARQAGITPMHVLPETARGDGLSIGGVAGYGATELTVSDVRISARARVPGRPLRVSNGSSLRIDPRRRTGHRVQPLLAGGLHTLGGGPTEKAARGLVTALRTDKLLTATPIKRGPPDRTHPTLGTSGNFSYDWRVVDRTFNEMRRLQVLPYISIDATPQILGGSVAPFSGSMLRAGLAFQSGFSAEVPRDFAAYGDIVRDLVHHVVVERGVRVPYWGVWNEPDIDFWKGSLADYLRLYDVVARAVKAVDPRLQVGGPETSSWNPPWADELVRYCANAGVPLDFFSWHYYSGNLGELHEASARMRALARETGRPKPPRLIVGEWTWNAANLPGTGTRPWSQGNFFVNDWGAAFAASSLMEMQRLGVAMAIFTNPVAEPGGRGYDGSGLVSSRGRWATGNAFRLWRLLGSSIVASQLDAQPGITAQASVDGAGRLTVLLARLQYRPGPALPLDLVLPAGTPARRVLRHYVIDASRSNAHDAGRRHTALESVPNRQEGRRITVSLRPRSVHLLVIDLPSGAT
jgi:Glycosyl hydrolases family 39/Concanavalin A-like lectin/glucanases superfamily